MNALLIDPTGLVLVGLVTAAVFVLLLAVGLSRPAASRAGLVAGGLPLALLPPVVAAAFNSRDLGRVIEGIGIAGYSPGPFRAACEAEWALQRLAWGAFAAACLLGLGLGLLRFFGSDADAPCSARRAFVLFLLPCLGLLVATPLVHSVARAQRVTAAVWGADPADPASRARSEARLQKEGFSTGGSGSLGVVSRSVARTLALGPAGGLLAAVVLLGLAAPGFVLAWRVGFGAAFVVLASTAWLLAAAFGTLAALGVLGPFRLLCDGS
jgi:hypothetical protein